MSSALYIAALIVLTLVAGVSGFYYGQSYSQAIAPQAAAGAPPAPVKEALTASAEYANNFTTHSLTLQGTITSRDESSVTLQSASGKTQSLLVSHNVQVLRQGEDGQQILEGTGVKAIPINEAVLVILNLYEAQYSVTTVVYPIR